MGYLIETAIEYAVGRLPALIVMASLFAGARWVLIRRGVLARAGALHELFLVIFDLYIALLLSLTFIPFQFTFPPVGFGLHSTLMAMLRGEYTTGAWGYTMFLSNVLMFIPFGFLAPLLWRQKWWQTLGLALIFILCVELFQPFVNRSFDVDDILLNLTGAAAGLFLFVLFTKIFHPRLERVRSSKKQES